MSDEKYHIKAYREEDRRSITFRVYDKMGRPIKEENLRIERVKKFLEGEMGRDLGLESIDVVFTKRSR